MVVDILKKHGDWVETSVLVRDIRKGRQVSERQAFRDIEKALETGKIRKLKLGADIVYGLVDWSFPDASSKRKEEALTFLDAFKYRCFRDVDVIRKEQLHDSARAMVLARSLIMKLPPSEKKELELPLELAWKRFWKKYNERRPKDSVEERYWKPLAGAAEVDFLIGEICRVLHEI